jgi:hypothetical protein
MSYLTFHIKGRLSYSVGVRYRVQTEGERELREAAENRIMNGLMVVIPHEILFV